jgi:hypothetical protein
MTTLNTAIFIFDGVEVLDFSGHFSWSRRHYMALSVVELLHRKAVADETAKYMEFPRHTPREARR